MDVSARAVVGGDTTISETGERAFDEMLAVIDGKRTRAKTRRIEEFVITEVHLHELVGMRGK